MQVLSEAINMRFEFRGGLARGLEEALLPGEEVLLGLPVDGEALAITSTRVIIIKAGMGSGVWFGRKVKVFPIEQITSVEVHRSLIMGHLQITAAGTTEHAPQSYFEAREVENVVTFGVASKPGFAEFTEAARLIRELMGRSRAPAGSVADELTKLANLRDQGILTEVEFAAAKLRLL